MCATVNGKAHGVRCFSLAFSDTAVMKGQNDYQMGNKPVQTGEHADIHGAKMTPLQFKAWRKGLGYKQKDVAELLGLKKRVIQYYEKGKRDGKAVEIPKSVELACHAISNGVGGFDGSTVAPLPPRVEADEAEDEEASGD
jgi:DNA-binding XRE family transcriptional regulator